MPRDCHHYRGGQDDVSGDWRIWDSVHTNNEYRIDQFKHEDVVIDIGCHIGSFSALAWERGSRHIFAFEINPESYDLALKNLNDCNGVQIHNLAVGEQNFDPILRTFEFVRYLKMDCEGCEWDSLYVSQELGRVQEIGGEYHILDGSERESEELDARLQMQGFQTEFEHGKNIGNFWAWRDGIEHTRL